MLIAENNLARILKDQESLWGFVDILGTLAHFLDSICSLKTVKTIDSFLLKIWKRLLMNLRSRSSNQTTETSIKQTFSPSELELSQKIIKIAKLLLIIRRNFGIRLRLTFDVIISLVENLGILQPSLDQEAYYLISDAI